MPSTPLPALQSGKPTAWEEAIYAFLVEKRSRSGSTRTVESYARTLWPLVRVTTQDQVRSADVLAYAHGIGASGRVPSSTTVGARVDEPRRDSSAHPRALSPRGRGRDPAWTEGERPDRLGRPASLHRAVQDIDREGGDDPAEVVLDRDSVVGTATLPHPGVDGWPVGTPGGRGHLVGTRREELCRIVVERVVVRDRQLETIDWTPPARPFFERQREYPQGALRTRPLSDDSSLAWYVA
jgi:hypothetical protein